MAGRSAPPHFMEFKEQIRQFGDCFQNMYEVYRGYERHLFITDVKVLDNNIQRSMSEVIGDFKGLQRDTEDFLKHYKFMVEHKRGSGNWVWKKVLGQEPEMVHDMESLRKQYMFQTSKITMALAPLTFQLLTRAQTTLGEIQHTVNRIEQLACSLCNQAFGEIIQDQPPATPVVPVNRTEQFSRGLFYQAFDEINQAQPQATAEAAGSRLRRHSTGSFNLPRQTSGSYMIGTVFIDESSTQSSIDRRFDGVRRDK